MFLITSAANKAGVCGFKKKKINKNLLQVSKSAVHSIVPLKSAYVYG